MSPPCTPFFIPPTPPLSRPRRLSRPLSSSLPPRHAARPLFPRTRMSLLPPTPPPASLLLCDITSVNKASLSATAFVFLLTFWGGISFVKGSTKPRVTQASFTLREPAPELAKRAARYLIQRSFVPDLHKDAREGVATFTGNVRPSSSVAAVLVAVAASAIWSATYILNFVLPENLQSPYWTALTLLSGLVVPWYWKQAARTEEVKLMVEEESDGLSKLYVKGHRDEIQEMERAFNWKRDDPVYEDDDNAQTAKAPVADPEKTSAQ